MDKETAELSYANYIKDKKVIFVGPAPNLIGKGLGPWIDGFDVVVRSNGSIFLLDDENYRNDYGSRCDVLYTNVQFSREVNNFPIDKWKDKWKLKYLSGKGYPRKNQMKYGDKIPVVGTEEIMNLTRDKIKGALMGPILLSHLSSLNPSHLWFTGMSFYIEKPDVFKPDDYKEYYPGYLPQKIIDKANKENIGRLDSHDQYSNTIYIKSMIDNGKVDTNDFIKELMNEIVNHPEFYCVDAKEKRLIDQGIEIRSR